MRLTPYLSFNGNCEEAMHFYADSLNGEIIGLNRFNEAPMTVSESDKQKVYHSVMQFGDNMIMASDSPSGHRTVGNNVSLSVSFKDESQIDEAFNKLAREGKVTMPLQDTHWGAKFGMLTDKFGINWLLNYDRPKN